MLLCYETQTQWEEIHLTFRRKRGEGREKREIFPELLLPITNTLAVQDAFGLGALSASFPSIVVKLQEYRVPSFRKGHAACAPSYTHSHSDEAREEIRSWAGKANDQLLSLLS